MRSLIVAAMLLAGGLSAAAVATGAVAEPSASEGAAILARRCVTCHNREKKTAGIDLSTRAGAMAAGVLGPDDPLKNRLVRVVTEGKMPPTGKLPPAETAALRQWVRSGAAYPREPLEAASPPGPLASQPLWSLQPVRRPPVPRTRWDALAKNPLDRFIFDGLARKGLQPSPPASRPALLRRVTLDLTGLPPTPEEAAAFLADSSPDAYEKVVDRLLASPAYGERWAQHWLDVVRYGESHGYEQNHLRPNAWPYRDYVIRALNEDRPYPRFIEEQLAGDVVGKGDPLTEAATGFLVAGVHDTVGNQTEEGTRQQRANDLDDMVAVTGETFLGLTVGCAKCHDHKFDPIPQKDYYRLAAVFAGVRHGERALSLAGQDGTSMGAGNRHREEFPPVTARFLRFTITATVDGTEPCLDELEVYGPEGEKNLALASEGATASASSLLPGYAAHQVSHLNDGLLGNEHSWISRERGSGWAQVELPQPARVSRVVWSRDGTEKPRYNDRLPSAYRIEASQDGKEWKTLLSREPDPRTGIVPGMQAYVGQFTPPDPICVLKRGDVMQRLEEVTPGALSRVPGLSGELASGTSAGTPPLPEAERRLALARWLESPQNPLTARVIVNRIWQHHFGRGIVGTPSDFGHNGEKPSHPELLDWLAIAFATGDGGRETGTARLPSPVSRSPASPDPSRPWSLKRLHRLIVTSYAYRQSSATTPRGMAADAGNLLLWRMPLQRMEAEAIRDAVLATSGKLDRRLGGPSFQLYRYRTVNVAIYEPLEEYGPGTWRRSVYRQPARAIRDELLGAFDCPESAQRTPRRESTTTALQALSLLNSPFLIQQAGFFAERVRADAGEKPQAQAARAFRLAFGRPPDAEEGKAAVALVSKDGLPALCRALLNSNEFLYY
jgi:cytochrome c553